MYLYVESSLAWSGSSPHGGCPYFERERGKRNGVKASGLGLRYGFNVGLGKCNGWCSTETWECLEVTRYRYISFKCLLEENFGLGVKGTKSTNRMMFNIQRVFF